MVAHTLESFRSSISLETFRVLVMLAREALDDPQVFDQVVDMEHADEETLCDLRKKIDALEDLTADLLVY